MQTAEKSVAESVKTAVKYFSYVSAAVLAVVLAPQVLGGGYSVLAVPFYNMICTVPQGSGFPAALVSPPPQTADYVSFLMDKGCSAAGAERPQPVWGLEPVGNDIDLADFWNDPVSKLFSKGWAFIASNFKMAATDTARGFIPVLHEHVLFRPAYYLGYIFLVYVLGKKLNLFVHTKFLKRMP